MTVEQRKAFLEQACAGAEEIRAGVEALLAALEKAGNFLADPSIGGTQLPPVFPAVGSRIGPYTLRRLLGEGGSGLVFLAEQEQPLRRNVALKVIKAGMNTREVIVRFEAERQVLAMMDHPNIAKVFDAGTSEDGRPYFVMELVGGRPVTEFCRRHRLPLHARVNLMISVCNAVQHAHNKGVVHRDLKPSNILVAVHDRRPVAKVIDFGIAKALDASTLQEPRLTQAWQLLGTPQYMSPEQVAMSPDIDARSDVYSLGATLYEVLTGVPPFDPEALRSQYMEVQRLIRETDPPAPSRRVELMEADVVESGRRAESRRLARDLRGDLDAIVAKAMAKAPGERYPTAAALGEDLRRYLDHEPISVRPPGILRRVTGPARRRATAIGVILTAVLIGCMVMIVHRRGQRIGKVISGPRPVAHARTAPFNTSSRPVPAAVPVPVPTASVSLNPNDPRQALLRTSVLYFNFDPAFVHSKDGRRVVEDLSARHNDGLLTGGTFVPGVFGDAIRLGPDDRIDSVANIAIRGNAPRTISFFFSPTAAAKGRWHAILGWGAGTQGRNFWAKTFRTHYQLWSSGNENDWNVPLEVERAAWHHHVITYDGKTARWYVDGDEVGSGFVHDYNTVDTPLEIGGWEFTLDELAVFDRALNAEEIHLLWGASASPQ